LIAESVEDDNNISSDESFPHIREGNTTDDGLFSQSEYFPLTTDNECFTHSITIYDSEELSVNSNAEAFIDGSVTIAKCMSPENGCFEFCVRTLLIHDMESPVMILKEPCWNSTCEHISIRTQGGLSAGHQAPCYLQALLYEQQFSEAREYPEKDSSFRQPLSLITKTHVDKTQNGNFTLILGQRGRFRQYAEKTSFVADVSVETSHEDEEEDYPETSSHGDTAVNDVDQTEGSFAQLEEATETEHPKSFSKLPCFHCREDALQPRVDAGGGQALFLVENNSFGYTCQRCKDRTWVSATTFGLTLAGASWSWW
jgi:hypothetical protein